MPKPIKLARIVHIPTATYLKTYKGDILEFNPDIFNGEPLSVLNNAKYVLGKDGCIQVWLWSAPNVGSPISDILHQLTISDS